MAKKKNAKQIVQNKNEGDKQGLEMESDEELLETSVVPETSLSVSRTLGEEDSPASPKVNEEEDEIGDPICIDALTGSKKRISYSRVLMDVNLAKGLVTEVPIKLPNGKVRQQAVIYEQLPKFYTLCHVLGHSNASCKGKGVAQADCSNQQPGQQQEGPFRTESGLIQGQGKPESGTKNTQDSGIVKGIRRGQTAPKTLNKGADSEGNGEQLAGPNAGLNQERNTGSIQEQTAQSSVQQISGVAGQVSGLIEAQKLAETDGLVAENDQQQQNTLNRVHIGANSAGKSKGNSASKNWAESSHFTSSDDSDLRGDFNSVLSGSARNGNTHVSSYEVRHFLHFCVDLGLVDLNSTGFHYTWTNNIVWSKIDRVMSTQSWFDSGWQQMLGFFLWVVFLITLRLFFSFGVAQKKLKLLKTPLKALSKKHFGHISTKVDLARKELNMTQFSLHDNPQDTTLRRWLGICNRR
ncbi:hypothetical protein M9H77_13017 [Catharanthus roseus]|uniref:Uncharacterized protein n=1 Tax=Catharanthus roseus TaxID=4058 RepID=A0ACC0BJ79_CATRO|nr:hypothetical protein M9H77_13017 [Catharanthus roseus]